MATVAARFSQHAATYDAYAVVQAHIAARLVTLLAAQCPEDRGGLALDIGAGTGLFSKLCAASWPNMRWLALDTALASLRRNPLTARVVADAARLPIRAGSCALLASNCALQWCDEPLRVLLDWRRAQPQAMLAAAFFIGGTLDEWHQALAATGRMPPRSFMPEAMLAALPKSAQFSVETLRIEYETPLDFLRALHGIGAGSAAPLYPRLSAAAVRAACAAYPLRDGRAPVSYEAAYVVWPPA